MYRHQKVSLDCPCTMTEGIRRLLDYYVCTRLPRSEFTAEVLGITTTHSRMTKVLIAISTYHGTKQIVLLALLSPSDAKLISKLLYDI